MAGYHGNGSGPAPLLTIDTLFNDDRPYIVAKTEEYPDGERFYCPDIQDMDALQLAQLQHFARRYDELDQTIKAFAADPEHLDPTVAAEFDKIVNLLIDILVPDLPDAARRRMGVVGKSQVIEGFFGYLAPRIGAGPPSGEPTPTPLKRSTGARSSRVSAASGKA